MLSYKFVCRCGKCEILTKNIDTGKDSDFGPYVHNIPRAGTFIHTQYPKRVLLVQSYNGKWGPPKGRLEDGETGYECAVRETVEETGIDIEKYIDPCNHKMLKGKWDIYNIQLAASLPLKLTDSTEITGIGWMTPQCIRQNRAILNHPAKLALSEFARLSM